MIDGILSKDDLELAVKEMKSQRVQLLIQLNMLGAAIASFEGKVKDFGD